MRTDAMTTPMAMPFLSPRQARSPRIPRWHELRMLTITREDPAQEDEADEKTPVRIALRDLAW